MRAHVANPPHRAVLIQIFEHSEVEGVQRRHIANNRLTSFDIIRVDRAYDPIKCTHSREEIGVPDGNILPKILLPRDRTCVC